jgi:hypothetical protein
MIYEHIVLLIFVLFILQMRRIEQDICGIFVSQFLCVQTLTVTFRYKYGFPVSLAPYFETKQEGWVWVF